MSITFQCDQCGKKLKAADHLAGRKIKCPGCQAAIQIIDPNDSLNRESTKSLPREISNAAGDDPFAGDWFNSDEFEDPTERKRRIAARHSERESKLSDSEVDISVRRKPKTSSEPAIKSVPRRDSDSSQRFRLHWIYLLALIPLTFSVLGKEESVEERFTKTLTAHPEVAQKAEQIGSLTDLLMALPEHRIEGAWLPRDTLLHWVMGGFSAAAYLGLLFGMFPGTQKRTFRLLRVGLFTGTIGIVLLLAFQWIAEVTQGVWVRGHGVVVLIFWIIKLIGYSYRCAEDPSMPFWGSFFGFTIGVGLCEELCKALPIWYYLRHARKTGWRGACLTGLASGIGFGVSEGIMYSGSMYNGISDGLTYVVRFVSCVSLHAMWSGSVALLLYRNQDALDADNWAEFLMALLYYTAVAMILHGLYDTLLKHDLDLVALLIGAISYLWLFYQVSQSKGT